MPVVNQKGVLGGITVEGVMRRQLISLPLSATVDHCINRMIKFKVNSVLITGEGEQPVGLVSKTDIVSAFYAGFSSDIGLEQIMVGPLLCCYPDDELEDALDSMQKHHVHRLYVKGAQTGEVIGVLAYPDIVGLLYRYCRACSHGRWTTRQTADDDRSQRLKVKEVMTSDVTFNRTDDPIAQVIESLTSHRLGAVLIRNRQEIPVGVVSKTDLILAYKHGRKVDAEAESVMNTPVQACEMEADLTRAIQQMLTMDVQRIFIQSRTPPRIVGVLSLSDAARFRAGSCRACISSRIIIPP